MKLARPGREAIAFLDKHATHRDAVVIQLGQAIRGRAFAGRWLPQRRGARPDKGDAHPTLALIGLGVTQRSAQSSIAW